MARFFLHMNWLTEFRAVLQRQPPGPLIMTLATVDAGTPRARSIICREIGDDGRLWFTTDARSQKVREIRAASIAEAVYWSAATRDQFRFLGPVAIETQNADRHWRALTDATRATFLWPSPGEERDPNLAHFPTTASADSPIPPNFALLILTPTEVEHLSLVPHPHRRRRWSAREAWSAIELNP
jgi:pyridoxamine 5'-phosphate oxidase